jgi:hypothetical protein
MGLGLVVSPEAIVVQTQGGSIPLRCYGDTGVLKEEGRKKLSFEFQVAGFWFGVQRPETRNHKPETNSRL